MGAARRGDARSSAGPAPGRGRSDGAGTAAGVRPHRCGCAPVSAVPGPALPLRPSAALCPLITGGWGEDAPGALANRETLLPGFILACFFFFFFPFPFPQIGRYSPCDSHDGPVPPRPGCSRTAAAESHRSARRDWMHVWPSKGIKRPGGGDGGGN